MKETNWFHVEYVFSRPFKEESELRDVIKCFRYLYGLLYLYVDRKFFLFAKQNFAFFALELKDKKYYADVKKILARRKWIFPDYMKSGKLVKNTKDENNNEGFLFIMDAVCSYSLLYGNKEIELAHLIHCMLNSMGFSRQLEHKFYETMQRIY